MTVQFVDPRAEPGASLEPYELVADIGSALTIGLMANGFPDSVRFLDYVEKSLHAALPDIKIKRYNKGNASVTAGEELLDGITKECHAVITAYGH